MALTTAAEIHRATTLPFMPAYPLGISVGPLEQAQVAGVFMVGGGVVIVGGSPVRTSARRTDSHVARRKDSHVARREEA